MGIVCFEALFSFKNTTKIKMLSAEIVISPLRINILQTIWEDAVNPT